MQRRQFLKSLLGAAGTALLTSALPVCAPPDASVGADRRRRFTIVHSNDVHSHIDPFPDNDPLYPGLGGYARRQTLIDSIRRDEGPDNTLVVESGDMFQGTPYFNFYQGRLEIELMNKMGVDAVTIGNHEFDTGLHLLAERVREAHFPFLISNYDFSHTPCRRVMRESLLVERGGVRIGLLGLGVELDGLVEEEMCHGVIWSDPVERGEQVARQLKRQGADIVVALTHIGLDSTPICDVKLAQNTTSIDVILGGHSHTLMETPILVRNQRNRLVVITQSGYGGVAAGILTFEELLPLPNVADAAHHGPLFGLANHQCRKIGGA